MAEAQTSTLINAISLIDQGKLDLVTAMGLADRFKAAGLAEQAIILYKYWLLAHPDDPLRYVAAYNGGVIMQSLNLLQDAQRLFQAAIKVKPDFYLGCHSLALCQERGGDREAAMATLRQVVDALKEISRDNIGNKVLALKNIARLQRATATGEAALKEAAELDPTQTELVQHWVNTRQTRCVWPPVEPLGPFNQRQIEAQLAPLTASMLSDDPAYLLRQSVRYTRQQLANLETATHPCWPLPARKKKKKLKIGYLSSDMCNHAIGYLMRDVFKHHNHHRYEISIYNIGERNNDGLQQQIANAVDRWIDIKPLPDKQAAKTIVEDGIDILLDINGHTNFQRTRLLAMKPAPILVNWLGYPGTMGSDFHDYIIADDFIVPPGQEVHYSERVLRLPCYQPNGALGNIPPAEKSRDELGLPENGFVFCCFNGSVKITAEVFSRWMTILKAVPDSVLWLRGGGSDDAPVHLRQEAERQGVSGKRLIVLPFQANTQYLACHRYAHLFLDTFPYGAHTTASDALRMGVPIVTLAGEGFPSRVCGSLSHAAGMPETVCRSPREYVEKAIHLATHPEALAAVRDRLKAALPACTLFDSAKLVRHLEPLFEQMWEDYCSGKLREPMDFKRLTGQR